jgi:hypothetical protein
VRLDSTSATWPIYQAAGYREIRDYNDNPHADFWGEKRLGAGRRLSGAQ